MPGLQNDTRNKLLQGKMLVICCEQERMCWEENMGKGRGQRRAYICMKKVRTRTGESKTAIDDETLKSQ